MEPELSLRLVVREKEPLRATGEVEGSPRPSPWASRDELGEDRKGSPPPVADPRGDGRRGDEGYRLELVDLDTSRT